MDGSFASISPKGGIYPEIMAPNLYVERVSSARIWLRVGRGAVVSAATLAPAEPLTALLALPVAVSSVAHFGKSATRTPRLSRLDLQLRAPCQGDASAFAGAQFISKCSRERCSLARTSAAPAAALSPGPRGLSLLPILYILYV